MSRALIIGLVLLVAGVAAADPYVVNPAGTHAVVNGKAILQADAGAACLNLTLLSADPLTPSNNDLWCVSTGGTHRCCVLAAGIKRCWDATLTP